MGMFDHLPSAGASSGGGIFDHLPNAAPLAGPRTFRKDEDEDLYQQTLTRIKDERSKPRVPRSGYEEGTPEEEAIKEVQQLRGKAAEQKAFDDSRTTGARVADAATFIPSALVRAVTRGQYGVGDVASGLGFEEAGNALAEREANFARANQWGLEKLAAAGEVAAGIPVLNTMGAPIGGIGATVRTIANQPMAAVPLARATARNVRRNERLADLEAFKDSGVAPFGPAFTEAGTAGVVKQLSDAPVVGGPVRNRLLTAIEETRDAGERVASQYGDARSFRDAGNVADRALNRFRDERIERIQGRGSAAPTPDSELAQIARAPARETSLKTKGDAVYERAWRGIPEDMAQGRSKKEDTRFLGGMTNTKTLLEDISARNQRMYAATRDGQPVDKKLSYPVRGGVPGQIVEDIIEGRWRGNLQSMRDVRSNFRRLASGISDTERNTLTLSDMRRIQSAMTQDMIGVLERNVKHYEGIGDTATAARVRRSIHDFRRADQFTKASAGRLETIEKLYGAQSAESLGKSVLSDAMGGRKGGNLERLTALRRSLRDDEWDDIASGVIRELGRPMGSVRGAAEEAGFSVNSFTTQWNNMSPEGKAVLFKNPRTKELGVALDKFARVADRMANFEALANTSRSGTNMLGVTGLASILTAAQQALTGNLQTAGAAASVGAGMYAFGRFMTSPAYVRWLTRATELSANPNATGQLKGHARALIELAAREEDVALQQLGTAIGVALDQQVDARARAQRPAAAPGRRLAP
jgi:hypothetical protein